MYRITLLEKGKILKNMKMTKIEATSKVKLLLIDFTIDEISAKIGISKPTLYTRLSMHNWKLGELALIKTL